MPDFVPTSKSYLELLARLKEQIRTAQVKAAALAVNSELVLLYWRIGKQILERQGIEGWDPESLRGLQKISTRNSPT